MNTLNHAHHSSTWVAALAAFSCAVGAGQAFAGNESDAVRSEKVSFADLNLSTVEGATALYRRIAQAAGKVCGPDYSSYPLGRYLAWKQCYKSAIADAVAKVNSPMLTAVHNSKTNGTRVASVAQR